MLKASIWLDDSGIDAVQNRLDRNLPKTAINLGNSLINDMRAQMEAQTNKPSNRGEVPAIRTGALYRDMEVKPYKSGARVVVGESLPRPYASYLETGTWKMGPRPYLQPAIKRAQKIMNIRYRRIFFKR